MTAENLTCLHVANPWSKNAAPSQDERGRSIHGLLLFATRSTEETAVSFTQKARHALQRAALVVENTRLKLLSDDEKRALLALLRGVSLADGVLSAAEHDALTALAEKLGVPLATVSELSQHEAVTRLARSPRVLRLACLVVADTFFVDGDFDESEKDFVLSFGVTHGLSSNPLQDAVESLRARKLDDAIAEWSADIDKA